MRRVADGLRTLAWFAGLLLVIRWLQASGAVAGKPGSRGLRGLLDQPPELTLMAGVRLLALTFAWYLLVASIVVVLASATNSARAIRIADALAAPVVHRMVRSGLGLTLVATSLATPFLQTPAFADEESTVVHQVPAVLTPPGLSPPDMSGGPAATTDDSTVPVAPSDQDPEAATETADGGAGAEDRYVVQPGDHFWSIATRTLQARGSSTGEHSVGRYWIELIEANRASLADPMNPDLIYPGQTFILPASSEPASAAPLVGAP